MSLKRDPDANRRWQERSRAKAAENARAKPRKPLERKPMKRSTSGLARSSSKPKKRRAVSPASEAQRAKVKAAESIVSGVAGCDPAHVWPRSLGGCDDPLCVVPLTREEHDLYDAGELDLLPHLMRPARGRPRIAELQHALAHAEGSLLRLIHQVTGVKHVPSTRQS